MDGPALEAESSVSSLGTAFVTRVGQVVQALTSHRDPLPAEDARSRTEVRLHGQGVKELLDALDNEDDGIDMSAMMTGYARVTGLLRSAHATPRCVVASPLVVEYATTDSARVPV
ncbi:hypothetical protein DC095_009030 [Streptomyces xinghaiensis]|nr:hypothetical protein DC095_009030 [Streptomyces xinghaiensis]